MQKYITKYLIAITDIVWLILLFYITLFIRKNINGFGLPELDIILLNDFLFVIFILFTLMYYEKIYDFRYDFWHDTLKVTKAFVFGFLLTLTFLALSKTNLKYSRAFIIIYFSLGIVLIPILKRYTKKLIFKFDIFKQNILLIGKKNYVDAFKFELSNNWYLGQRYSRKNYINTIIISKGLKINLLNKLIERYSNKNTELFIVPYVTDVNFAHSNILEYSNIRLNAIHIENKLLNKSNILIKNIFDKISACILFIPFTIIHLFVTIFIKMNSKGSIWFKQHRLGQNDVNFEVYKYRTMYINGDEILKKYLEKNPNEIIYYEKFHKYKNDPRITKVGEFLRATSLDELPQLLNVIKGNMSLVGPRPYMTNEDSKLEDSKHFILKVKPGITGLWQVSGRNKLTFKERNELEVWYIKNWSLWADIVILMKTIKVVFSKLGAS